MAGPRKEAVRKPYEAVREPQGLMIRLSRRPKNQEGIRNEYNQTMHWLQRRAHHKLEEYFI